MAAVIRSYRRSDGAARCVRLSDHLSLPFGEEIVFRDVDDLLEICCMRRRWPAS
jgi:hypothetical protein